MHTYISLPAVFGANSDEETRAHGSFHISLLREVLDRVEEIHAEGRG